MGEGDPFAPRKVGVTIKVPESKRYANDNPWFVFEGTPESIKADIIATFGLKGAEELSLHAVVVNAQNIVTGIGHVSNRLGGKILSESEDGTIDPTSSDVWAKAQEGATEPAKDEPKQDPILAALETCQSVADVQQVWAENQQAFNDNSAYMDAYKARGKALAGK